MIRIEMIMRVIIHTTAVCLILSLNIFAQYGSIGSTDARSMGMGKTYSAINVGVYSIGINPANLMREDSLSFQIATVFPLPTFSAIGGSDVLSLDDLNYFLGGVNGESRLLNDADKQRLNDIFASGGFIFANASAQIFSISIIPDKKIGAFGFSISDYAGGKLKIPSQFVDLFLNGNPVDKVFDFSQADLQSWWIRNYSLSYARTFDEIDLGIFKDLSAGITVKLVQGFAYTSTEKTSFDLLTSSKSEISANTNYEAFSSFSDNFGVKYSFDSLDHDSNFELFPNPAGTGFGLDIGLSFNFLEKGIVSVALTDLGSIEWRKNAARFSSNESILLDDVTDKGKLDSLVDLIKAHSEPVSNFTSGLATALRFGVAYLVSDFDDGSFPGHLLLAADYNQGFNNLPGNSTKPRFSLGVEWGINDYLPYIRTGLGYSDVQGFNWALGLGFITSLVDVNVATSSVQTALIPGSFSNISLSLSSRWKFY